MKHNEALLTIFTALLLFLISASTLVPFSIAHAKGSHNKIHAQDLSSTPPEAQLIVHGQKITMSPFVFIQGGKFSKLGFPALPDSDSHINVQEGSTISFEFNKKPLKVDAYIVDYDGDMPSALPLKQIGSNSFEIAKIPGIWNIEARVIYPDGKYTSYTALTNVLGSHYPESASINSVGQVGCGNPTNLQIQGVTDNDNKVNSLQLAHSFNTNSNGASPNVTAWSSTGKGSWLQFDLGKEKSICRLLVGFANGDKVINFFSIQTSTDGIHFVDEGTVQNTGMISGGELFNIPNSPVQARYVKITFLSDGPGEISNINVMGSDGSSTPADVIRGGGNGISANAANVGNGTSGTSDANPANSTNVSGGNVNEGVIGANGANEGNAGMGLNGGNGVTNNGAYGTNANGTSGGLVGNGGVAGNGGVGGTPGLASNSSETNQPLGTTGSLGTLGTTGGLRSNASENNGTNTITANGTNDNRWTNGATGAQGVNGGIGGNGGIGVAGSNANGANADGGIGGNGGIGVAGANANGGLGSGNIGIDGANVNANGLGTNINGGNGGLDVNHANGLGTNINGGTGLNVKGW
ncbi:MAG: discoidin domain-containing protein [Candidatus Nitrosopolaris sp.]